eukprot:TRINITY_DN63567_c0_g1_i1.p1 TRINITY_DN63567_c0_g1~~TRINITY_DN63567_c0_g1_i1.p1  ORF type:complete len:427 (-),score=64.79 TRINITY_DN63567_c0_g1_i1:146-1363(-)
MSLAMNDSQLQPGARSPEGGIDRESLLTETDEEELIPAQVSGNTRTVFSKLYAVAAVGLIGLAAAGYTWTVRGSTSQGGFVADKGSLAEFEETDVPDTPKPDYPPLNLVPKDDPVSLYCWSVAQPYEMKMISWQYSKRISVFGCNAWSVFSDNSKEKFEIGKDESGNAIYTVPIPGQEAIHGYLNGKPALFNEDVFLRAWKHIGKDGVAVQYAWTVKADVDAMFLPYRLQTWLRKAGRLDLPDQGAGKFIQNCQTFGSMQGPLEVISRAAMISFTSNSWQCQKSMDWMHMGEDIFLAHCLGQLKSMALPAWGVLEDVDCSGQWSDCTNPNTAAFHPKKKFTEHANCWLITQQKDTDWTWGELAKEDWCLLANKCDSGCNQDTVAQSHCKAWDHDPSAGVGDPHRR